MDTDTHRPSDRTQTAILAGGCFWCTEAVFNRLKGVVSVTPGYTGGHIPDPTYEQVCTGTTGHAESVRVVFNPAVLPFPTLLDVFFHIHDPTTPNRQGNDIGPQYRSAVFYTSDAQRRMAEEKIRELESSGTITGIVTEVKPAGEFYPAEEYHREYYDKNRSQPYCRAVIDPKIRKLMAGYAGQVR